MPAWSAVVSGLAQGVDAATNTQSKAKQLQQLQLALDEQKRATAAEAAQATAWTAPQSPTVGAPSMPGPAASPAPPASPAPAAPAAAPQAPQPNLAALNSGGQQPPPSPAGGRPGGAAGPPAAPSPAPGQQASSPGPGPSGGAQPEGGLLDPNQEAMGVIRSIATQIKQANPKIDPMTLFAAVKNQLGMIGTLSPNTRAAAANQMRMLETQIRANASMYGADQRRAGVDDTVQGRRDVEAMRDKTLQDIATARGATQLEIAQLNDNTKAQVAGMNAKERLEAVGITAGSRVDVAQIDAAAKRAVAQYGGDVKMWTAQIVADAKNYATQAGAGGARPTKTPAPAARPKPQMPAAPAVGVVQGGYKFMGGDPANPGSWKRVAGG